MENSNKSSYELIRQAEQYLRDLKKTTKDIDNYIQRFEMQNLTQKEIKDINNKWQKGVQTFKNIEQISNTLQNRNLEEEFLPSLNQLHKKVFELKPEFEKNLMTIKNFDYIDSYIENVQEDNTDLEEQLLDNDLDVEEIIDQETLIKDRNKNIMDINRALNDIKNMNQHIFEIIKKDDEQINLIIKKQEQHLKVVKEKVNVDLVKTERLQDGICRKTVVYGGLSALLLFFIVIIYFYVIK